MTDPIRKSVNVPLRPAEAFDVFTRDIAAWWPCDTHSLSAANGELPADITVEDHTDGQIIETRPDGTTAPWGRVTTWDPGSAFGLRWHVGRPEEEATDVLVVFTPTDTGTMVELTHSGFDTLGETAAAQFNNYNTGWDYVLGRCYARHYTAAQPIRQTA